MKVLYLFSILFLLNFSIAAQLITFTDGPVLPDATSAVTSAVHQDDIYLVNGFMTNVQFSNIIYKLDGETLEWSVFTDQSISKRYASAEVIDDKLYVFNGQISGGLVNDKLEIFDLIDGSVSIVDNPFPSISGGITSIGQSLVFFGGRLQDNTYSDKVNTYNTTTGEWATITTMPIATETKGTILDNILYIVGGYNGEVSDQLYAYDFATLSWADPISMPMPNSANSICAVGTELYIIGDFADLSYTAKYNTSTDIINVLESNIQPRRHCATANINGTLWVMGGNTSSNTFSSLDNVQFVDLAVSNQELIINTEMSISPNPAFDVLKFSDYIRDVKVINSMGQIVLSKSESITEIVISELVPGAYYIIAKSDKGLVSMKWNKL